MAVKTGNGQLEEKIRESQRRFAQGQERFLKQAEEQAEEVKHELQQANELGRQAADQYVHAMASGYQAFIPPAVIDPRPTIDFAADWVVQTVELQRSLLTALIGAGSATASVANASETSRAGEAASEH